MKLKLMLFIISLVILIIATFLTIEFSDSQRMSLIAGSLFALGFLLNIASFFMKDDIKSFSTEMK